jgi:hypothetical protein
MRLLLTANSPGEMAGWVRPLVKAWRAREVGPADLLLLPCTFATGQEERVARELEGIDRVYARGATTRTDCCCIWGET